MTSHLFRSFVSIGCGIAAAIITITYTPVFAFPRNCLEIGCSGSGSCEAESVNQCTIYCQGGSYLTCNS